MHLMLLLLLSRLQDTAEDIRSIDSCEYIWEAGVGFAQSPPLNYVHDLNRYDVESVKVEKWLFYVVNVIYFYLFFFMKCGRKIDQNRIDDVLLPLTGCQIFVCVAHIKSDNSANFDGILCIFVHDIK